MPEMRKCSTRRGVIDVAIMDEDGVVLVPFISAWSLHRDRLERAFRAKMRAPQG